MTVEQLIERLQKYGKTLPVDLAVDTPEYKTGAGTLKVELS